MSAYKLGIISPGSNERRSGLIVVPKSSSLLSWIYGYIHVAIRDLTNAWGNIHLVASCLPSIAFTVTSYRHLVFAVVRGRGMIACARDGKFGQVCDELLALKNKFKIRNDTNGASWINENCVGCKEMMPGWHDADTPKIML